MKKTKTHFNNGYFLSKEKIDIIRDFHEKNTPPYLIGDLIKEFADVESIESVAMATNISGRIKKNENGKYDISLNESESYTRRRFTAAHELAHLLLHKEDIGDGMRDDALYRSKLSTSEEAQANKLAADILMPFDKIYELLEEGTPAWELPDIFEVSRTAMCIRLGINEFVLLRS